MRFAHLALAALLCAAPNVGTADTLELTPEQMVTAAGRALALRRPEAALALAEALLTRDPKDIRALLIKARALRDLGRNDAARAAAGLAWQSASNADERFSAALVSAQALASAGHDTTAQIWLRRATQHATTDRQRALIRRDFGYLRQRNPLAISFSFGALPSSNVNGGANSDTITLFGLPFELSADAQALSGYQAYASANLSYRILDAKPGETRISLAAYQRQTWLSAEAQAAAPTALGSDYNYASLAFSLSHQLPIGPNGRKTRLSVELGRNWYGGAALSDFASLTANITQPLGNGRQLDFSLRGDAKQNTDPSDAPVYLVNAGVTYLLPTENRGAYRFSASLQATASQDADAEYSEARLGVDYFAAKPFLGGRLSLGIEAAWKDYDVSFYRVDGRHDQSLSAHVNLTLPGLSLYGFSPEISLKHARTFSNIELYTSEVTSIGFSFRSDF